MQVLDEVKFPIHSWLLHPIQRRSHILVARPLHIKLNYKRLDLAKALTDFILSSPVTLSYPKSML